MNAMDILEMLCMLTLTQITAHRCEDVLYLSDLPPSSLFLFGAGSGFKTKGLSEVDRGFKFNDLHFLVFGGSQNHDPATSCFFTESLCDVTFLKTLAHQFLPSALAQGFD